MFSKTMTRTLAAEEPMVTLDAAAITQRIGSISHPEPQKTSVTAPIYQAMRPQQTEAKWRRALRPRSAA